MSDVEQFRPQSGAVAPGEGLLAERILASSLCGIYIYNIVDGRNDFINDRYTALTGWTLDELNAMSREEFAELFHPQERGTVMQHMADVIDSNEAETFDLEYRFRTKPGRWIWCLSRDAAYERSPDGSVVRFIGTFLDVTSRKKREAEESKLDSLRRIGRLAGGIAHDFNNVLTGVYGNLSLALMMTSPDDEAHELLTAAQESMSRATALTHQLLTFAKGGDPQRALRDVAEIIREAIAFDLSGGRVKLEFDKAPGLWGAKIDQGQIQQVFSNLAANAVQAMPNGGHLFVVLRNRQMAANEEPGLAGGPYVEVVVRDEGCGIPESHLAQVFDPFFTTKQLGSGIGLATSFSIVERHKGRITVSSELGAGTTFTVLLPATKEDASTTRKRQPAQRGVAFGNRVLVMDDERLIRKAASVMLQAFGCEADCVDDGQAAVRALEHAKAAGSPYDLVILDLTVPGGMGGVETAKKIRATDPDVCLVVSSGYSEDPVMATFAEYGFNDVLPKPYVPAQLRAVLERHLARASG